ncbi:MAG: hypothetical protein NXH75_08885, partial [Halobacteriovoraceae bacterium]|nr:hypothetical protein [Halobacteriovoraceae bacterium]
IDYISMKGVYNVLGMNGEVGYGFSIDEIKRGKSLSFYADYNSEPILKITPNPGFNENDGGAIRFQFWDGKKYQNLNGHLARDQRGEFKLFIKNVQPANEVSYLRVNVRGMSPGSMRIKEYEVQ